MSKLYSVSLKYYVTDEHQIRAESLKDAESKILQMAKNDELNGGNIYDAEMEDAEIVNSGEAEE